MKSDVNENEFFNEKDDLKNHENDHLNKYHRKEHIHDICRFSYL